MQIGNHEFNLDQHTYVMGILNVTPDSFSDGGKWNRLDAALAHTEEMIADGAAIIDIGGESTRPGYTKLSDAEEIEIPINNIFDVNSLQLSIILKNNVKSTK